MMKHAWACIVPDNSVIGDNKGIQTLVSGDSFAELRLRIEALVLTMGGLVNVDENRLVNMQHSEYIINDTSGEESGLLLRVYTATGEGRNDPMSVEIVA